MVVVVEKKEEITSSLENPDCLWLNINSWLLFIAELERGIISKIPKNIENPY